MYAVSPCTKICYAVFKCVLLCFSHLLLRFQYAVSEIGKLACLSPWASQRCGSPSKSGRKAKVMKRCLENYKFHSLPCSCDSNKRKFLFRHGPTLRGWWRAGIRSCRAQFETFLLGSRFPTRFAET